MTSRNSYRLVSFPAVGGYGGYLINIKKTLRRVSHETSTDAATVVGG